MCCRRQCAASDRPHGVSERQYRYVSLSSVGGLRLYAEELKADHGPVEQSVKLGLVEDFTSEHGFGRTSLEAHPF